MTTLALTQSAKRDAFRGLIAREAPRKPWAKFVRELDIRSGEHVGIIGPTGQGKTHLQKNILPEFPFVAVFATKPIDRTMTNLVKQGGYTMFQRWPNALDPRSSPTEFPRRVLWPDASRLDSVDLQRDVFENALDRIFREGGRPPEDPVGWAVGIDELWYFVKMLNLSKKIKLMLLQGRSLGISMINASQRPVDVPVEVYDQSTHLFFFRDNDRRNLQRLSEINARDSALVRLVVQNLEPFQVLYINTRTGSMVRTRTPPPSER